MFPLVLFQCRSPSCEVYYRRFLLINLCCVVHTVCSQCVPWLLVLLSWLSDWDQSEGDSGGAAPCPGAPSEEICLWKDRRLPETDQEHRLPCWPGNQQRYQPQCAPSFWWSLSLSTCVSSCSSFLYISLLLMSPNHDWPIQFKTCAQESVSTQNSKASIRNKVIKHASTGFSIWAVDNDFHELANQQPLSERWFPRERLIFLISRETERWLVLKGNDLSAQFGVTHEKDTQHYALIESDCKMIIRRSWGGGAEWDGVTVLQWSL